MEADLIISGAGELLTCARVSSALGARSTLGAIPGGAVAAYDGRVVWTGSAEALPEEVRLVRGGQNVDADGRVVMPGLVECHAHLAFAGDRADEFQLRVAGATYQEIAAAGGGIMSTVHATRAASDEMLRALTRRRLDHFLRYGVTTVEAKSGYGLSQEQELRLLEVYRDVAAAHAVDVVPTLLAAHAVPVEYSDRPDDYVKMIVKKMIPAAAKHKLAKFCDAFCEKGAFTPEQCRQVLEAGSEHGLLPKLHADQLSYTGGAELAAELGAVSADHLDHVSEAGVAALAASGANKRLPVAVLLPGATFFLGEGGHAPARRLLDAGARVALSTDLNPGSSPTQNLWLMATMGGSQLRMTAEEVIRAITIEAAAALAVDDEVGSLEVGKKADILILEETRTSEIPYRYGMNPVWRVYKDGRLVVKRDLAGEM
ncbi:MAG: imidazolonepropionase [Actinobacteria bacterium RBG_16_64_13]|nr:MAG: imidazolonepropionase [Actinobacteria bacterium RBG_16_64_13]